MIGQSFTELKNKILSDIIQDTNIVKSLVIHKENFLDVTPTTDEQYLIDNSEKLLRKQIFPYKNISLKDVDAIPYITMSFLDFRRLKKMYINGSIRFYIIVPVNLEKTDYGSRYDVIVDMLDELFSDYGIGTFEFKGRGDVDLGSSEFQGHSVLFEITDFHWKDE